MILLSKPASMKKVIVACPHDYSSQVLTVLQNIGVIDVEPVESTRILEEYERLRKLRDQIMSILSKAKVSLVKAELYDAEAFALSIEKIEIDVKDLLTKIELLESQIGELRRKHDDLTLLRSTLDKIPQTIDPQMLYYRGKHISSLLAVCRREYVDRLVVRDYVKFYKVYNVNEDLDAVITVIDSEYFEDYIEVLRSVNGWFPHVIVQMLQGCRDIECVKDRVKAELEVVAKELNNLELRLVELVRSNLEILGKYMLFVNNELSRYMVFSGLSEYKYLSSLQGWIPSEKASVLLSELRKTDLPVFVELRDPGPGDNPPTLMKNKPIISFYQVITRLYGVPRYWEWDPTPLVAYSFAFFFGLMNADAGYALLGLLAVLVVLDKLAENPHSPYYRELKGVLLVSNTVALVVGLLSGTLFGDLLRLFNLKLPVLFKDVVDPLEFIKLSLIVGLVHVNIAHVLATVRFLGERKLADTLVELGLLISEVFGIPLILEKLLGYRVPVIGDLPEVVIWPGVIAGVSMIIAGSIINMKALGLLMWIFQITGLLGDVLSYVRLAGVGMATYYMALAFNFMIEMLYGHFGDLRILGLMVATPLLILSHLFVLVLAQLGAFVHSLRLCMLEFLTKFYDGSGREYAPFRATRSTII
ncbi:MAG: V-type ATPase 116kDa subunit family protein, partial [Desulfurococcaceae archaeon]